MDCLDLFIECLTGRDSQDRQLHHFNTRASMTSQPAPYSDYADDADEAAARFIRILRTAECSGKELEDRLRANVSPYGWKENLAERILRGLEKLVKESAEMASTMREATEKATNTALEFVKDHPYYTALIIAGTIVAIGVLVLVAPWVLEALGFAAKGPRLGSFAARWMSQIALSEGEVSKGSIYAYLQRLGMTWK